MSLKRREILVENVASLSGVTAGDGDIINLLGYYTPGDGGGQTLRYSVTASGTANAGSVFDASGIGRFESVNPEELHALHFGFSTTEAGSAARLQVALEWASANTGSLRIPAGDYTLDDEVYVRTNTHLYGDGAGSTIIRRGQGGNWTSQDAILFISTRVSRSDGSFNANIDNVTVSDMTLDFNFPSWQDFTPAINVDGRGLAGGYTDTIKNVEIHHIEFINSGVNLPSGDPDAWCITANPRVATAENLRVHDCISPENHQFISLGNGTGWDGVWVYNNYIYNPRDNGITVVTTYDDVDDGAATPGTVTHNRNIHIYGNTVIGATNFGIWCGVDGSARARGARVSNINIIDNHIIQNDHIDPAVSGIAQYGIGVTIPEAGIEKITIRGNKVRHTENVNSGVDASIIISPQNATFFSGTINAAFTQPAVGSTVSISFATDPDLRVDAYLIIGDATSTGGLYRVSTIDGGGAYTVTRIRFPIGTADGLSVAAGTNVVCKGFIVDGDISDNACDGLIDVRHLINSKLSQNSCNIAGQITNRALNIQYCDNLDVIGNKIKYVAWILYANSVSFVGNVFNTDPLAAGWIQMKSNDDEFGRTSNIDVYLKDNRGIPGVAPNQLTAQTTNGAGTHTLSGELYRTGSPEGVVIADVGTKCIRTNGGSGTTLYIKESGTGNTGWVAK